MKKVITTTTTIDYIEDFEHVDFDSTDYPWSLGDEPSYTQPLSKFELSLEGIAGEMEEMSGMLERLASAITKTSGISEDDRDRISKALEDAASNVWDVREECENALFDVTTALQAFAELQVQECIEVQE